MIKSEEMKEWMKILASEKLRPMSEEYVFDDGENPFEDDVAFNGLVDGAGEFPLWEKDSHK